MTRRGTAYGPPTLAPHTAGSGSSSSPAPLMATPDASVFNDGQTLEAWQERHERERAKGYNGNGGGTPLAMQVRMLPTPDGYDGTRGGAQPPEIRREGGHAVSLQDVALYELMPTPVARDRTA